jgi:hypothetical protein
MRIAIQDLGLEQLFVVHPGRDSYPLDECIEAVSIEDLPDAIRRIDGD